MKFALLLTLIFAPPAFSLCYQLPSTLGKIKGLRAEATLSISWASQLEVLDEVLLKGKDWELRTFLTCSPDSQPLSCTLGEDGSRVTLDVRKNAPAVLTVPGQLALAMNDARKIDHLTVINGQDTVFVLRILDESQCLQLFKEPNRLEFPEPKSF